MFLSIIIPVYNGADCIARCLDSIWNQGLNPNDYEVICVNDCSTDDTINVIQNIQKKHSNLHLISNQINLHPGGCRNKGVSVAKGKYIHFIDADDYYHSMSLFRVFCYLKSNSIDLLMCDFSREPVKKPNNIPVHRYKHTEIMTGRDFLIKNGFPISSWKFVFKKSLMIKSACFFAEKVQCEDADWCLKIGLSSNSMKFMPIVLLHYVLSHNGISSTFSERNIFHLFFAAERLERLANNYSHDIQVLSYINSMSISYKAMGLKAMCMMFCKNKLRLIKCYIKNNDTSLPILYYAYKYPLFFVLISNLSVFPLRTYSTLKRIILKHR